MLPARVGYINMGCKNPCSCHNATIYDPTVTGVSCSEFCASSRPCAYAIFALCPFGEGDGELFMHKITVAWMDCLFEETYSARRDCSGEELDPGEHYRTEGKVDNTECSGMEYDVTPHNPHCYDNYIAEMLFGSDFHPFSCTQCTWRADNTDPKVWEIVLATFSGAGGTGTIGPARAYVNRALCNGTETRIAEYIVTESYGCVGRTTMSKTASTNPPDEYYNYLPERICVVPYASNWSHQCGVNSSQICSCYDDGCSVVRIPATITCFGTVSTTLGLNRVFECPSNLSLSGPVTLDVCDCITSPPVGDCGFFWASQEQTCSSFSNGYKYLFYFAWCSGSSWTLQTWCYEYVLNVDLTVASTDCTMIDEQTITRTNICGTSAAMEFLPVTIDASASDCCTCTCPSCDIPNATYNYDITGPGNGSGTVVISSGSATFCFVKTLSNGDRMSVEVDLSDCTARIGCNGIDCSSFNCISTETFSFSSCDPLDFTITIVVGFLCSACARGTYTVHIYE